MKPWRTDPASPSDFAQMGAAVAQPHETVSSTSSAGQCAVRIGASTLALGFVEACLHIERRPIPLPFATKFALYNVIPSAVWSTIGPHHVAAVSNLPSDRLATPVTVHGGPNLEPRRAKRFIGIKTLRSLRYGVASYGIVWTAWRWHEECFHGGGDHSVVPEDSAHVPITPSDSERVERVVRLAPSGSSLSKATAVKHGDHVRHVPWRAVQRGDAIDWSTVGLEEARPAATAVASDVPSDTRAPLKVLELEIDSGHDGANAFLIAKRAAAGANGAVHTVAVVDTAASPEWHARSNGVDVYFFALSGVIQFLCEHLEAEDMMDREIVLVTAVGAEDDESALEQEKVLLHTVRRALIRRHGIPTSIGIKHALHDNEENDEEEDGDAEPAALTVTALFAPTADAAVKHLARIAGLVPVEHTLVVVDESLLSTKSTLAQALAKCAGVLSIADLTDSVLQRVREQLRAGISPEAIQLAIFGEFGEQSALLHRADAASDTTKYI